MSVFYSPKHRFLFSSSLNVPTLHALLTQPPHLSSGKAVRRPVSAGRPAAPP